MDLESHNCDTIGTKVQWHDVKKKAHSLFFGFRFVRGEGNELLFLVGILLPLAGRHCVL